MNELHDKTTQQLNMMVARIIYPDSEVTAHPNRLSCGVKLPRTVSGRAGEFYILEPDWINDDALAFGLIRDNGMAVVPMYEYNEESGEHDKLNCWATLQDGQVFHSCKDLGRLVIETFILMNQHKEG